MNENEMKKPVGPRIKASAPEARKMAAAILDVLAGSRTPAQAAQSVAISLQRYYQIESRALNGMVDACSPKPRGPKVSPEKELERKQRQMDRLNRELDRQKALVRASHRAVGLTVAAPPPPGKHRRRKPAIRALRAAEVLRSESFGLKTVPVETAAP